MKKLKVWLMVLCLGGGTMMGTSCTTDMRDAIISGAYDFLSGTTTDLLNSMINGLFNGGQPAGEN